MQRLSWPILSIALLAFLLREADWHQIVDAFAAVNYGYVALAIAFTVLSLWLRARRWAILFFPEELPNRDLFDAVSIGYLANNLLPARGGDLLRSYLIAQWTQTRVTEGISTTLFERIFDSLVVVVMFLLLLPLVPLPTSTIRIAGIAGIVLTTASICILLVLSRRQSVRDRLAQFLWMIPYIDGSLWSRRLVGLLSSFTLVGEPRLMARVGYWSLLYWVNTILVYWLILQAFGLDTSLAVTVLSVTAAALGLAVQTAPAGLGTFEGAVAGALFLVGIEADLARSAALGLHAVNFFTLSALGIWSLIRRGLVYEDLTVSLLE